MYNLKCPDSATTDIVSCVIQLHEAIDTRCTLVGEDAEGMAIQRVMDAVGRLIAAVRAEERAERDAARAECRRWTDCAEQALVARDRYKAALEKIATLYDGFVGTSDYRETDEVRIARTALDAGEDK